MHAPRVSAVLCFPSPVLLLTHAHAQVVHHRGGVDQIMDVMSRHANNGDLLSAACGLLWKLAFADPSVRTSIINASGISHIMGGMNRHPAHSRLHYHACGALRHLLVDAPRQPSVSAQLASETEIDARGTKYGLPPIASGYCSGTTSDTRRVSSGRRQGAHQCSQIPVGAPPRMLLSSGATTCTGSGARTGNGLAAPVARPAITSSLRGASSDPHIRNSATNLGARGVHLSGALRPSTVSSVGKRQVEASEVRPIAREEVSLQALRLTLRSMMEHSNTALVQEYGCGTLLNLVARRLGVRTLLVGG